MFLPGILVFSQGPEGEAGGVLVFFLGRRNGGEGVRRSEQGDVAIPPSLWGETPRSLWGAACRRGQIRFTLRMFAERGWHPDWSAVLAAAASCKAACRLGVAGVVRRIAEGNASDEVGGDLAGGGLLLDCKDSSLSCLASVLR